MLHIFSLLSIYIKVNICCYPQHVILTVIFFFYLMGRWSTSMCKGSIWLWFPALNRMRDLTDKYSTYFIRVLNNNHFIGFTVQPATSIFFYTIFALTMLRALFADFHKKMFYVFSFAFCKPIHFYEVCSVQLLISFLWRLNVIWSLDGFSYTVRYGCKFLMTRKDISITKCSYSALIS